MYNCTILQTIKNICILHSIHYSWTESLDISTRNSETILNFKLKQYVSLNKIKILLYLSCGSRRLNVLLTLLRCFISFLNKNTFRVNIIYICSCQLERDSYNYFLECHWYTYLKIWESPPPPPQKKKKKKKTMDSRSNGNSWSERTSF